MDSVRRSEVIDHDCLKGARFAVLKNQSNLTVKQAETRENLSKRNLKTMRAIHIRESFQAIYLAETVSDFLSLLKEWYFWATHSRLEPIKKVAKTIKRHWDGILRCALSTVKSDTMV